MARIYVASSWRNEYQPKVVKHLIEHGHMVYDFRNPSGKRGFHWSGVDFGWQEWSMTSYRYTLTTNQSVAAGFVSDYRGMQWADTCLLVLPCGRSAHLEAGYFNGANKRLIILIPEPIEPDLMYLMAQHICLSMDEVIEVLK